MGDFILTLPAIQTLRAAFPQSRIEILGYRHIVALAEEAGYVDATRSIEAAELARFFARDAEPPEAMAAYFSSFDAIVTYLFDPDGIFAANLARTGAKRVVSGPSKMHGGAHASVQLSRPLRDFGLSLTNAAPQIRVPRPDDAPANCIAIHPGSGSPRKNWPAERWAEFALRILRDDPAKRILIVGGEADDAPVAAVRDAVPADRTSLALHLPLPRLAALLGSVRLFAGHDSGVSHLAAATGVPCLLLFGPTDPDVWAPANPGAKVLRAPDANLAALDVETVLDAAYELMRIGIST